MHNNDFITSNIGNSVYVSGEGDLAMISEFRYIIRNKIKLTVIKLTKKGMAYLQDEANGDFYSVPPRNVREYSELTN